MDGIADVLNKLSVEDVEKLSVLFNINMKSAANEIVTLRVFCDEYRNLIRNNCSQNYYSSVNISLNHLTKFFPVQKSLETIRQKDIELFLVDLQQSAPKGYRVYYRTLKAAFNKAVDWSYISVNPFVKVKLQKKQTLPPMFIEKNQLDKIVGYAEPEIVRDVITLAYYTGLRLDEIVNLKWKNIKLDSKLIVVGDEEFVTKGKKQRFVPICDEVHFVLNKIKGLSDINNMSYANVEGPREVEKKESLHGVKTYVFGKTDGSRYTGDYFSKRFKKACRAAGMDEGIHFHSLRHSFASNLVQKGVSLYVVKELLGHSSIKTTEIYSHLNVESLREAVNKLDERGPASSDKGRTTPRRAEERSEGLRLVVNRGIDSS